mgnify:FL=1
MRGQATHIGLSERSAFYVFAYVVIRTCLSAFGAQGSRNRASALRKPRRARRGFLLIGAALGLSLWVVIFSQIVLLRTEERAIARAEAVAIVLSDLGADFDLFVHQNQTGIVSDLSAADAQAMALSAARQSTFLASAWRLPVSGRGAVTAPFALALNGIDVAFAVSLPDTKGAPMGVLLLQLQAGEPVRLLSDVETTLARKSTIRARDSLGNPRDIGALVLGAAMSNRQAALTVPMLSGLKTEYVFREARVGHGLLSPLETSIGFERDALGVRQHAVTGAVALNANSADVLQVGCMGSAAQCGAGPSVEVFGAVDVNALTVNGPASVVSGVLSSQAVSQAELSGLSLVLSGAAQITGTLSATLEATFIAAGSQDGISTRSLVTSSPAGAAMARFDVVNTRDLFGETAAFTTTTIGQDATISPAISAGQLVARTGQFGLVSTGSCLGC